MNVAENVGVTARLLRWPKDRIAARVDALLEKVQLDPADYRDRPIARACRDRVRRVGGPRLWAIQLGTPARASLADGAGSERQHVRVGSKAFTEQYILAEILASIPEDEPNVSVQRVPSLGSTVAFDALVAGDLDLFVDYTGTLWATILGRETLGQSRETVLEEIHERLREDYGVHVIASLGFRMPIVWRCVR